MEKDSKLSRRKFLTNAGLAVAGYGIVYNANKAHAEELSCSQKIANRIGETAQHKSGAKGAPQEPNMKLVELECDVFVAGGGLAGVCAAISAARAGKKVVLCQDRSRLGGNASSENKMHPLGIAPSKVGFREGGIIEEIKLDNSVKNPQNSWELWDFIMYDKVITEKNITLLLDAPVFMAESANGKISTAWVRCDISQQMYKVNSKIYIDCTGDARLAMEAGDDLMSGREGVDKYGESNADYDDIGTRMGSSILFTGKKYDTPMPFYAPKWAVKIKPEHLTYRKINPESLDYGYWWIELGGNEDAIANNEKLRFELLAIVMGIWDYIKNSGKFPGAENWAIESIGMVAGRRDSYRIKPEFLFTQHGITGEWRSYKDNVCVGGWSMDDHPKGGFWDSEKRPCRQDGHVDCYNIPFGCLISKKFSNLMMAGRNVGVSHVALTSTRVMVTCAVMGQAVGTAAAMSVDLGKTPAQIRNDAALMKNLQQELLKNGQSILETKNEDPKDLARIATITASNSIEGSTPQNIINGITYDFRDKNVKKSYFREVKNRWIAPVSETPWVELSWATPQKISSLQFTFDTGCHVLAITGSTSYRSHMQAGAQPETVKDFKVIATLSDGSTKEIADIKGNYQRLCKLDFDAISAQKIRIEISATNGDENAAIFEIRTY